MTPLTPPPSRALCRTQEQFFNCYQLIHNIKKRCLLKTMEVTNIFLHKHIFSLTHAQWRPRQMYIVHRCQNWRTLHVCVIWGIIVEMWRPELGRGGPVESNNCKLFAKFPPIDYFKQCPTFALINWIRFLSFHNWTTNRLLPVRFLHLQFYMKLKMKEEFISVIWEYSWQFNTLNKNWKYQWMGYMVVCL